MAKVGEKALHNGEKMSGKLRINRSFTTGLKVVLPIGGLTGV